MSILPGWMSMIDVSHQAEALARVSSAVFIEFPPERTCMHDARCCVAFPSGGAGPPQAAAHLPLFLGGKRGLFRVCRRSKL
jgi:hypothetical protein